ncbi:gamma-aminobutyric-acid receptor subunit beta [Musicola keenii]|uniref:gamma-aminobutyric-acid receptor subunit beta n=1 Tax=Musicola keenii TaxID=2884250 RepID=UPI00177C1B17|nr:gamma-aminobutyric-acid receptor subunit beta [Musicola keenii]
MFINKIYSVNTLEQTYKVDGYIIAEWRDAVPKLPGGKPLIIENSRVDKFIANGQWVPALEFINVVGTPESANKRLILYPDGRVTYDTRFLGTFSNDMDFRRFPFDHQQFVLELEPFSYSNQRLRFSKVTVYNENVGNQDIDEWWVIGKPTTRIGNVHYDHLEAGENEYSRVTVQIDARRNPSYYLWSFILPLGLIIAASWSVFWLESFSEQLQTAFTLMLTVVAYAFYTSNILPRLPYTTIIDQMIITGYGSIFASILLIIFAYHHQKEGIPDRVLIRRCRVVFPVVIMLFCGLLIVRGMGL